MKSEVETCLDVKRKLDWFLSDLGNECSCLNYRRGPSSLSPFTPLLVVFPEPFLRPSTIDEFTLCFRYTSEIKSPKIETNTHATKSPQLNLRRWLAPSSYVTLLSVIIDATPFYQPSYGNCKR